MPRYHHTPAMLSFSFAHKWAKITQAEPRSAIDLYYPEATIVASAEHPNPAITLAPLERYLFDTGVYVEVPFGWYGNIKPKSGISHNYGLTVHNSPGRIESTYRGTLRVNLVNLSNDTVKVLPGSAIAQFDISEDYSRRPCIGGVPLIPLSDTRDDQGHGSTGGTSIEKVQVTTRLAFDALMQALKEDTLEGTTPDGFAFMRLSPYEVLVDQEAIARTKALKEEAQKNMNVLATEPFSVQGKSN